MLRPPMVWYMLALASNWGICGERWAGSGEVSGVGEGRGELSKISSLVGEWLEFIVPGVAIRHLLSPDV